jgi:hypothetical protein
MKGKSEHFRELNERLHTGFSNAHFTSMSCSSGSVPTTRDKVPSRLENFGEIITQLLQKFVTSSGERIFTAS